LVILTLGLARSIVDRQQAMNIATNYVGGDRKMETENPKQMEVLEVSKYVLFFEN